ncbi:hypothetical protein GCM10023068_16560 [Leifsonia shinshuensis]
MRGTFITVAAAIATIVWSSTGFEEAALGYAILGSIPTAILAVASTWIAIVALTRHDPPRWMAVTALVISGLLALPIGIYALVGLSLLMTI